MIATTIHTTEIEGVTLEERHTSVTVDIGGAGLGFAYRRPTRVVYDDGETAVRDVMFILKFAALVLTMAIAVTRRLRT